MSGLEKSVLHLFDHLAYGGVKWVDFEFRIADFEFERRLGVKSLVDGTALA